MTGMVCMSTKPNRYKGRPVMKNMMLALSFVFINAGSVQALDSVGEISRYEGKVKVYRTGDVRGKTVRKDGYDLYVKDIVKTKRRSRAFLRFTDNSDVLLKEGSILEIEGVKWINVDSGRVIFNIKKQRGLKGVVVKTKSVVIGVKGTTFLVDKSGDRLQVYLKEGTLNIQSFEEEFVRYRKKEMEEYMEYKKRELEEFQEYKRDLEEEFKEFVKEFDMAEGTAIVIDGNEVRDIVIPEDVEEEFRLFAEETGEI